MKRSEFEHAIRAVGAILGTDKVLIIGSQAIHASVDFRIPEAERSIEVDISAMEDKDGSKADLIDGSIGELSIFQETYGYYAQGVTPKTAVLPDGWRKRLVPFNTQRTNGVTAFCLDPHDLWLSKAVVGRQKDKEFCKALLRLEVVGKSMLVERLKKMRKLSPKVKNAVQLLIDSGD